MQLDPNRPWLGERGTHSGSGRNAGHWSTGDVWGGGSRPSQTQDPAGTGVSQGPRV